MQLAVTTAFTDVRFVVGFSPINAIHALKTISWEIAHVLLALKIVFLAMQGYARRAQMDFTWPSQQELAMLAPMVLSHAHFLQFNSASQVTISSILHVSTVYQIV